MDTKKTYVPILKWKKGEEEALRNLSKDHKEKILPLIEIIDYKDSKEIFKCIESSFEYPVYIDTLIAAEDDRDFLISIISEFKDNNKIAYPVIYFNDLIDSFTTFSTISNRVAIKISLPEDIDGPSYDEIFKKIEKLKTKSGILLDIILDIGIISKKQEANRQFVELKQILNKYFINKSFFNSIIICSTSFPEDISSIEAGDSVSFKRYDILLFKKIFESQEYSSLQNKLIYSDFGVTKFTDSEMDFSKLRYGVLPKIKYTTNTEYLVFKGKRNASTGKLAINYSDLANHIVNSSYYFSKDFSFGDLEIFERAKKIKGTGNGKNWVTISANHHIAALVEQLSKFL